MKLKIIATVSLLLVYLLGGSCVSNRDFDARLNLIVKPYRFSIVKWESVAIPHEINQWIFNRYEGHDDEAQMVTEYFSSTKRIETLKLEIQAINAGNKQGDSAVLEA